MNSTTHRFQPLCLAAALFALVAGSLQAQMSVGRSGLGPLTFDTMPADADFDTYFFGGTGTSFTDAMGTNAVDRIIASNALANFSPGLWYDTNVPPVTWGGGFVYNATGKYIQSRPTTTVGTNSSAGIAMVGHFKNDSGAPITSFTLSYSFSIFNAVAGELPGFRVFYSPSGVPGSWVLIPALSGTEADVTQSGTVSLTSPWAPGQTNHVLWFDDNANGVTDPAYTIDNLKISLGGPRLTITLETNQFGEWSGNALVRWSPAVGTLQSATDVTRAAGSWTVEGTNQPAVFPAMDGQRFFKLVP
jgi:hypothetical protein